FCFSLLTPSVIEMAQASRSVSFSVIFFDGQNEIFIGDIVVYPSTNYKDFQLALSQKIGISPNQFSVYLTSKKNSSPEYTRRIPITSTFNFGSIGREKDMFFLVVMKISRRMKTGTTYKEFKDHGYNSSVKFAQPLKKHPLENILGRKSGIGNQPVPGLISPMVDQVEYQKRLMNLQIVRERYLRNMGLIDSHLQREKNGGVVACEECLRAEKMGKDAEFHPCVFDAVIRGPIRSPAGPIARPGKRSG
ncbi:DNA-directed RNA polymerase subunit beta like, partial [Quillaja saponaria]